jgi:transcriptional regulator with XRE-family HTH domain
MPLLCDSCWRGVNLGSYGKKADLKREFGTSVQFHRKQLGITKKELAARTGLQCAFISDVERGTRNVSLETTGQFACGLAVPIPALFAVVSGQPALAMVITPPKA